jgi:outer membrane protein assembly factor BamB
VKGELMPVKTKKSGVARRVLSRPSLDTNRLQLLSAAPDWDVPKRLRIRPAKNPRPNGTLGDVGPAVQVIGPDEFPLTMLRLPIESHSLTGIDSATVRIFRWDTQEQEFEPVWSSGINDSLGFAWAKVRRPGTYMPIGLPRDRLLQEALHWLSREHHYGDLASPRELKDLIKRALEPFHKMPESDLEKLRQILTELELMTGLERPNARDLRFGRRNRVQPFPLPHDASPSEFRKRINKLNPSTAGLPEENLFFGPDRLLDQRLPWRISPFYKTPWNVVANSILDQVNLRDIRLPWSFCWLLSQDWWMYHGNEQHTGVAAGCSDLSSQNVGSMILQSKISLDHDVVSVPAIVGGKIYIGTMSGVGGGTLYKINMITGTIEHTYTIPFAGGGVWNSGIGATPAVVNGKVYISTLDGKIYCLDALSLTFQWVTDLRHPDLAHNQPVNNSNPAVGCWTAPLVVNDKVYVGVGLGEDGNGMAADGTLLEAAFGFVYCLSAMDGHVEWLFCTNKFTDVVNNSPNDIPHSLLIGTPSAPFTRHASDPSARGASVWSSCVYDRALDRIYVGTGNPNPDHPLPNEPYSSGVLSLDATNGQFRGFFQPDATDSYRPVNDLDVDMPSSPTLFSRGGQQILVIGSKNGGFFLLDPSTMTRLGSRQLLPYYYDDPSQPIPGVDPEAESEPGENHSGMYGSAAVHYGHGYLFAGLGGWGTTDAINSGVTPFLRALRWDNSLGDAWPTTVGTDHVRRYSGSQPPIYSTPGELACSSPAVVNDLVFVTTNKPALYALDTATGTGLWSAPGLPAPASGVANITNLGPAISGNYVVIGCGANCYIYTLQHIYIFVPQLIEHLLPWQWPPPPPEGPDWGQFQNPAMEIGANA